MSLEIITITAPDTGATAKLLPEYGFNCFSFQAMLAGQPQEILWTQEGFETGTKPPSHSGIPILFPFPGRLKGTKFVYQGKVYLQEPADGLGNPLHGFALNRPWEVTEKSDNHVVGRFHASKVDPEILNHWPSDFLLRVSYHLEGNTLSSTIQVENPSDGPLPCGLGTHPYFRLPLGSQQSADECVIQVPTQQYWELAEMLPTGNKLPAAGNHGLADGMKFADCQFDTIFTDLGFADGWSSSTITDVANGRRVRLRFNDTFTQCVLYTPPHREAICLEPYTCLPAPYEIQAQGIQTGLRELSPGESFSGKVVISVE